MGPKVRAASILASGGMLAAVWLAARPTASSVERQGEVVGLIGGVLALVLAAVLVSRLPGHPVTRVITVYALATLVSVSGDAAAALLGSDAGMGLWIGRLGHAAWSGTLPMLAVLVTVFPNGAKRGWRIVMWGQLTAIAVASCATLFVSDDHPALALARVGLVGVLVTGIAAAVGRVLDLRRATGDRREQLAWFVWTAAAVAALYMVGAILAALDLHAPGEDRVAFALVSWGFPAALGLAVLRRRLYGLDLVLNRILVWAAVSALLAAGYLVVVVVATGIVDETPPPLWPAVVAAGLVAGALAPLRDRLQRWVDRLMYGDREEPHRALHRLGLQLHAAPAPDTVPSRIVDAVTEATRSPWVVLEVHRSGATIVVAERGERRGDVASEVVPLTHAGDVLGRLLVQPRPGEAQLPDRERQLLADLGRQSGMALYAARATAELRRSHERLVRGREGERARLRRDLHDGLSPTLAGISLAAQAALPAVRDDPQLVERLLEQIATEAQRTGETVRRLLADLRPVELDVRGLLAAVEDRVRGLAAEPRIDVRGERLPPLTPPVEIAAYRITIEAVTNAVRHARASQIDVVLAAAARLVITVSDDGAGMPPSPTSGVGIRSMKERTEELGGRFLIAARPGGGTIVTAELPLNGATP